MRSAKIFLCFSVPIAVAGLVVACGGDDAASGGSDGGGSDATVQPDTGTPLVASDADTVSDAEADTSTDTGIDSGPPFDAGPPVWYPLASLPGTSTYGSSVGDSSCTFQLAVAQYMIDDGGPQTLLYLLKKDTTPGSCNEPKGFVPVKFIFDAADADAFIVKANGEKLIAVASDKFGGLEFMATLSVVEIVQFDWYTGAILNLGTVGVKGADAAAPSSGDRITTATGLSLTNHDVVLSGHGYFPGAPNDSFVATYAHFLSDAYQSPNIAVFADSVE